MRVLVTGGRAYSSQSTVFMHLDAIHQERPITQIIQGGATGADALAREWARQRGVEVRTFYANWSMGPGAGNQRNLEMLRKGQPSMVVAFAGGNGTAHMIQCAKADEAVELVLVEASSDDLAALVAEAKARGATL